MLMAGYMTRPANQRPQYDNLHTKGQVLNHSATQELKDGELQQVLPWDQRLWGLTPPARFRNPS